MQSGREGLISHLYERQPVETVLPVSTASISLKRIDGRESCGVFAQLSGPSCLRGGRITAGGCQLGIA